MSDLSIDDRVGSTVSNAFQIGAKIGQLSVSELQAAMPSGWTASIFSGTQPPDQLTTTGYTGPPALLASNWMETPRIGDAFSGETGGGVNYALRSTFNEGMIGAPLTGISPTIGSGTWYRLPAIRRPL